MKKFLYVFFLSVLTVNSQLKAQTLPVGIPVLDDYYRRAQLMGKVDSNLSFAVRPLFNLNGNKPYLFNPDSSSNQNWKPLNALEFGKGLGYLQLLPITTIQQYNANMPYGWNDGAMIPARGWQSSITGGVFAKIGPLSIQFKPEYIYAQNKNFNGFADLPKSDVELSQYFLIYDTIDNPERFGTQAYSKFFLGQSSIRLTFNPISLGISNENVWWGPGINNALILTNNAPGFKHLTLNSTKPIKTFLGYFEFQWIAGRLDASGFPPLLKTTTSTGEVLLKDKRNDWRYFTGINFNYHLKWVPGLTFGLTRTFNAYRSDIKSFSEYVPLFFPYQKASTNNGDDISRDQITSFYGRWLFRKARAEVYFEYGLNDHAYNYRDFLGSIDRTRSYLIGMRKMIELNIANSEKSFILLEAEVTQMSQSVDRLVHNGGSWYRHYQVKQGHTNIGQVLGAGIGPGGNLQHFGLSFLQGVKKLGLTFDRYEHHVELSDSYYPNINGGSRKWVDLAFGFSGDWSYRNFLVNATLQHVHSLNYEWYLKDFNADNYYIPNNTATNFHAQLGVTYRF